MLTDVGEYLVGAYLQGILECDFVQYNVRPPGGGLDGLGELDVVGFDFKSKSAYLCEVTTHLNGLRYGNGNADTIQTVTAKHQRQIAYGRRYLTNFDSLHFQFWSPVVPVGVITRALQQIPSLELIINGEYSRRVEQLRISASQGTHDARNPVFRLLQILTHLRKVPKLCDPSNEKGPPREVPIPGQVVGTTAVQDDGTVS